MISAPHMKRIADLTADQARARAELAVRQSNDREELLAAQQVEREQLGRLIGVGVDQVAGSTARAPADAALPPAIGGVVPAAPASGTTKRKGNR